jgi:hypothetical protein
VEGLLIKTGWVTKDRDVYINLLRDMNALWGSFTGSVEFIEKFLLKDVYDSDEGKALALKANLLGEFIKNSNLIPTYATEMNNALSKDGQYDSAQRALAAFFSGIGTDPTKALSKVDNYKTWIELMSVTGIFHGATLSMTRVLLTPSILAQVDPTSTTVYTKRQQQVFETGSTTLVGAEKGRYVFSNEYPSYKFTSKLVQRVADKYSVKVSDLKDAYFKSLTSADNADYFKDYGWLLVDYAPEFTDGRQSTIATYF